MEQLLEEVKKLIETTRMLNKKEPFLSGYENGVIEGSNNVVDDLEAIVKKYDINTEK